MRNGIRAYGAIEIAVGLYALAMPLLFSFFPDLARALLADLAFWPSVLARFALAFTVLCAPTIGMGLTLPLLTRALVRDERAGAGIALLYGLNSVWSRFCSRARPRHDPLRFLPPRRRKIDWRVGIPPCSPTGRSASPRSSTRSPGRARSPW
jgi:hypothetical protein